MSTLRHQAGLTLIELLIALVIFAVMAVMSYRSLNSLFQTRAKLDTETARLRDVSLFFARIESDLAAVINRPVRTVDDTTAAALCVSAFPVSGNDTTLTFTRSGFAESDGLASAPQRIGYRLREGSIEMLQWPALDAAPRSAPQAYPALTNVRAMNIRTLDSAGVWRNEWPPAPVTCISRDAPASSLPGGIELGITLGGGEIMTRVFSLRELGERG